jgi:hypothetical protein
VGINLLQARNLLKAVVPAQTGEFENCSELACRSFRQAPMTGPATVNLGVAVSLRGLSYPVPEN